MSLIAQHVVAPTLRDDSFHRLLRGIEGIAILCGYHALNMLSGSQQKRTRTSWTDKEVNSLLDFLYLRREKIADTGVFPSSVYNEATQHLQNNKNGAVVATKWSNLKQTYLSIEAYRNRKGTRWEIEKGADITTPAQTKDWEEWLDTTDGRRMTSFKTKGWKFYQKVTLIIPEGTSLVGGQNVIMPPVGFGRRPQARPAASEEDDEDSNAEEPGESESEDDGEEGGEEYRYYGNYPAANIPKPPTTLSSLSRDENTASRSVAHVPELPDLHQRFTLQDIADAVKMYEKIPPPSLPVPVPAASSSSSQSKKRNRSQLSLSPPLRRAISQPSSSLDIQPQQLHQAKGKAKTEALPRPSKKTRANVGTASMAVITGLSSALNRIADVVSLNEVLAQPEPSIQTSESPLASATSITLADAISLLQADRALSASTRASIANLFMESRDILQVYVLLDEEARHEFAEMQYRKSVSIDVNPTTLPGPSTSIPSQSLPIPSTKFLSHVTTPSGSVFEPTTHGDLPMDDFSASLDNVSSASVFMPPISSGSYAYPMTSDAGHPLGNNLYPASYGNTSSTQGIQQFTPSSTYVSTPMSSVPYSGIEDDSILLHGDGEVAGLYGDSAMDPYDVYYEGPYY